MIEGPKLDSESDDMKRNRNTKVVATIGPASASKKRIRELVIAGADVFRLNFSHGTHSDHKKVHTNIRELELELERPIAILCDLQGPKLRLGTFQNSKVELEQGQTFRLVLKEVEGNEQRVSMPHPEIFAALEPGAELLLDDGRVRLKVKDCGPDFASTEVLAGTSLSDRKGVNVPGKILPIDAITQKDREDLIFALGLGVDWVAMSFAQKPDDVTMVKEAIGGAVPLMVKIEKPSAVENLEEMIERADAIMVARGDLGVEMPPEKVPGVQKEIIRSCRQAGKPVVVATQMLESMISAPVPTRAEASDVATAVFDGADAVMLSGESAMGAYPVEAVTMMHRIISQTEQERFYRPGLEALQINLQATGSDAISAAAAQTAETVEAKAIITHTRTGSTAYRAARERPTVPILCLTPTLEAARQLCLVWGVHCVHTAHIVDLRALVQKTLDVTVKEGFAVKGDRVVITAGVPFGQVGKTNLLRIADV